MSIFSSHDGPLHVTTTTSVFSVADGDDFTQRQIATLKAITHDQVSRVQHERYRELKKTVDSLSAALSVALALLLVDTLVLFVLVFLS